MGLFSKLAEPIVNIVGGIVSEIVTDKDERLRLQAKLRTSLYEMWGDQVNAARDVIVAEAKGDSWPQRNWRPTLMFVIMGLLIFNGAVVPILEATLDIHLPILEAYSAIPEKMWSLLQIGLGGYIVGRSGEKIATTLGDKRKKRADLS